VRHAGQRKVSANGQRRERRRLFGWAGRVMGCRPAPCGHSRGPETTSRGNAGGRQPTAHAGGGQLHRGARGAEQKMPKQRNAAGPRTGFSPSKTQSEKRRVDSRVRFAGQAGRPAYPAPCANGTHRPASGSTPCRGAGRFPKRPRTRSWPPSTQPRWLTVSGPTSCRVSARCPARPRRRRRDRMAKPLRVLCRPC